MMFYPYTSPIILTDAIFQTYIGNVNLAASTPAQRQIAYVLAEDVISADIESFLLPTVVTGTYTYKPYVLLDHAYIQEVYSVKFLDNEGTIYWAASGTMNQYYRLQDDVYGVVDLDYVFATCSSCTPGTYPYQVQIAYRAGLPTGTANQPKILMALCKYTELALNEILGYGNEGVADIGITRFSNQQYSETRMKMINTSFGNSATAQFIHRMLDSFRKYRHVGI